VSDIFDAFNAVQIARQLGILEDQELPKHHVLFSPGTPSDAIYFIERGRVRLYRVSTEGKTVVLALLGPGDLIGEVSWQSDEHDCYGETLEDSRIYVINRQKYEKYIKENPQFGLMWVQVIGRRLKQAQARIEDLTVRQVPSRVARLLLALAEDHGKVTPKGIKVEYPLTHQEIAEHVGSSRVTVTQILSRFRSSNWIDIKSKRVTIQDKLALEEMVKHT
jgi:CRP/FNR family transcriptional regulator